MPDTPQQVQVKMPDGKMWTIPSQNLEKAKARGAVLVQRPSMMNRVSKGFKEYTVEPVKNLWSEAETRGNMQGGGVGNTIMNLPETLLDSLAEGQAKQGEQFAKTEQANEQDPSLLGTARSAAEGTLFALPGIGPLIRDWVTTKDPLEQVGKTGGFLAGEGLTRVPAVARGAAETARDIGEGGIRRTAQEAVVSKSEVEGARAAHESAEAAKLREHAEKVADIQQQNARNLAIARNEHQAELAKIDSEYEQQVQKVGRKTAEDEAAYKTKVEQAKDFYANKVAEHNRKAIEQSARESAATLKADTFASKVKSGPAYKRLTQMGDQVASSVSQLDKKVREAYNARWNAFHHAMGDAQGDFTPVQNAVVNAEDNILKGSPEKIAIFNNILKEGSDPLLSQASVFRGGSRGVDLKEVLGSMRSEGERTRFLRGLEDTGVSLEEPRGAKEGATLPLDQIQGYSTELGNKIYGNSSLPGDVRRALKSVKDAADAEVERVANSKGQGSVYKRLKSDWAQYMDDFYDWDGPLYKVKNAVNSDRRLALISGGEGNRVVSSLGHYSRFDPNIQLVGRVRSLMSQIDSLPSSAGTVPPEVVRPKFPERPAPREIPPRPAGPESAPVRLKGLPERPQTTPFSAEAYRRAHIQKVAQNLGKITGWDVASVAVALRELLSGEPPWALGYPVGKRVLSKMLTKPGVVEYLSKEGLNVPARQ